MANDLLSALKTYLTKISSGEKSPQEVAAALNVWAKESGEAIKAKIEDEVKKSVSRMGFAKASDLKRVERELMELKAIIKGKSPAKKSPAKTATGKKAPKKSAPKKATSTKKSVKK